jgi:mannose-6-phosphate isomerase
MGEFWFTEPGSSLLIKFLFTTENLSIQVHPNDEQAADLEPGCCGKTEMWHILKAEPGAKLAMGLQAPLSKEQLRRACETGSIMELLRWVPAIPGETWFIPAGTIHAIGAGITLAEVQQNSDVTYRLFDYGRPRELHLEKGLAVSELAFRPDPAGNLIENKYFHASVLDLAEPQIVGAGYLVVTRGSGRVGGKEVHQGEVWHLPTPTHITPLHAILVSGAPYDSHDHQH